MRLEQELKPDLSALAHKYDPVKAHEYYLRTRKLKGRRRGTKQGAPTIDQIPTKLIGKEWPKADVRTSAERFLAALPMAQEGAGFKETVEFVKRMKSMTDDEMRAEAEKIKKAKGNNDGAQVATIEALLKNRNNVRSKKADAKKVAARKSSNPGGKAAAKRNATSKAALVALSKRPG